MALDLICVLVAASFALVGAVGGLGGGALHLAAVAGGLALAGLLGDAASGWLQSYAGWPAPAARMVATTAIFFLVAIGAHAALLKATKRFRQGEKSGGNRLGGAVLGFLAGTIMAWVAISAVTFMEEPIAGFSDKWRFQTAKSSFAAVARRWSPLVLWSYADVRALGAALRAATDPATLTLAHENAALAVLAADARVKALAADKAVRKALAEGNHLALLRRKEVLELLGDPDVLMKLSKVRP